MSEEQQGVPAPEAAPAATEQQGIAQPQERKSVAERTREDIYSRYDQKFSDAPSETGESKSETDLKESSANEPAEGSIPDSHSDNVVKDSGKSTPVKKGKEPKADTGEQKTVPLQALHESRDRFKRLNLEYRDYKSSQEKEITELKKQLNQLRDTLKEKPNSAAVDNDFEDPNDGEFTRLRRELQDIKKQLSTDDTKKNQEELQKRQDAVQKQIQDVTNSLTDEGYPGFDLFVAPTHTKLLELVKEGEITDTESTDPTMWKKVFKEHIFPGAKKVFTEQDKADLMEKKTASKKRAQLVGDPGKAPERVEEEEDVPPSFDQFNKNAVAERMQEHRKRFKNRHI